MEGDMEVRREAWREEREGRIVSEVISRDRDRRVDFYLTKHTNLPVINDCITWSLPN